MEPLGPNPVCDLVERRWHVLERSRRFQQEWHVGARHEVTKRAKQQPAKEAIRVAPPVSGQRTETLQ